jgi:murein DD-endopeptidase MepM/ murein hydrolase activator NlpD
MANRVYTFIIVPNASSRLHKIRLSVRALYTFGAIGFISFFVVVGLGFSYAKMAFRVADYDQLQAENIHLKVQKKNLEISTVKLDTKLSALETLSERLTNLIENDNWNKRIGKSSVPAVGGSLVNYPTADLVGSLNSGGGVEILKDRTAELEGQMKFIAQAVEKRATILRSVPAIWPVQGHITSGYGNRVDPFRGGSELHLGLDISALYGSQVRSPGDGIVIYAQRQAAYGNLIIVNHGNGLTTRHGHLSRFNVHVGQHVRRDDVIGYVGTTGRTTAPHLHYEVRLNDRPINPRNYLPRG